MFKLVICDDEGKTTIVPLIRDEITIGRKEGNTLRLTDRNISRNHARLFRESENSFTICDLDSRNGTKIENESVGTTKRKIILGDQIYVGEYKLSIRADVSAGVPMGRQIDPGDSAEIGKVTTHARLIMLAGPELGKEFDLTLNLYVIGRSEEANLKVDDASISRAHARIDGDDHSWTISDLDSINGILINGSKRDDYLLKSGDIIELGVVRFRFVAQGEPYQYTPLASKKESDVLTKTSNRKLKLIIGGISLLAAIIFSGLFFKIDSSDNDEFQTDSQLEQSLQLAEFIELGKNKMKDEQWGEAALFFAEAQRVKPNNSLAKEFKKTANLELEAQNALREALEFENNQNWEKAVKKLDEIPVNSRYFNRKLKQNLSSKYCTELLDKAQFLIEAGDSSEVQTVLDEIGNLETTLDNCQKTKQNLQKKLNGKKRLNNTANNNL